VAVVEQPVEHGGDGGGVAEQLAPSGVRSFPLSACGLRVEEENE
jgi:hypothetical protein